MKNIVAPLDGATKVIEEYDALIERAHAIVAKEPFWKYIEKPELSRLRIDGENAILVLAELERGYYDEGDSLTTDSITFPSEMLTWPEARLKEWKAEMAKQHKAKDVQRQRELVKQREAQERAAYEALKKKFGS